MDEFLYLTADWHLRDRQFGFSWRGEDFARAAMNVVRMAEADNVKTVVVAGDIFEVNRPSPSVIGQLLEIDQFCARHGIRLLCISGNHDRANPSWISTLLSLRTSEPRGCGGIVNMDHASFTMDNGMVLTGLPYMPSGEIMEQLKMFNTPGGLKTDIIIWHGAVKEMTPFAPEGNPSPEDFPRGLAGVFLGDIHIPFQLHRKSDGALFVYPGSTEMWQLSEPPVKQVVKMCLDGTNRKIRTFENLVIPTRPVITGAVHSEEDLSGYLADVKRQIGERGLRPMVRLTCGPAMEKRRDEVHNRLLQAALACEEPGVEPLIEVFASARDFAEMARMLPGTAELCLMEALSQVEPDQTPARHLAEKLLASRGNPVAVLDEFVAQMSQPKASISTS